MLKSPSFPASDISEDDLHMDVDGQSNSATPELIGPYSAGSRPRLILCKWNDCNTVFASLQGLNSHINAHHVGSGKSGYTCEWTRCPRRGIVQTSRFALMSHLRMHTGERPFVCQLPECDKSFSRSDALAKHMRQMHNKEPPPPGRGHGSRSKNIPRNLIATFKISTPGPEDQFATSIDQQLEHEDDREIMAALAPLHSHEPNGQDTPGEGDKHSDDESSELDRLPESLVPHYDPATDHVHGRSRAMAMYLVMKAKYRYAQQQNEILAQDLKRVRDELDREIEVKDEVFDKLLTTVFGPDAQRLIEPVPEPPPRDDLEYEFREAHDAITHAAGPEVSDPNLQAFPQLEFETHIIHPATSVRAPMASAFTDPQPIARGRPPTPPVTLVEAPRPMTHYVHGFQHTWNLNDTAE
ncbi:hypothetical protein FISHEDRAFT_77341 [Fistulina hepatica ATCC 64428]|uniref:C2H2-type domain-containing protein n=1 Tax=Fistulina hepatica ATCC 64428 TaxID=1128425 RepID=A0A0D7A1U8_9AGAR|nr:hypothetical protein FISHEDRAFT_77341 [Fistulina hepatica ATCC 64428]